MSHLSILMWVFGFVLLYIAVGSAWAFKFGATGCMEAKRTRFASLSMTCSTVGAGELQDQQNNDDINPRYEIFLPRAEHERIERSREEYKKEQQRMKQQMKEGEEKLQRLLAEAEESRKQAKQKQKYQDTKRRMIEHLALWYSYRVFLWKVLRDETKLTHTDSSESFTISDLRENALLRVLQVGDQNFQPDFVRAVNAYLVKNKTNMRDNGLTPQQVRAKIAKTRAFKYDKEYEPRRGGDKTLANELCDEIEKYLDSGRDIPSVEQVQELLPAGDYKRNDFTKLLNVYGFL